MTISRIIGLLALFGLLVLVALWWTAADMSRAESRRRLASVTIPDLIPASAIHLHGDIKTIGFKSDDEVTRDANDKMRSF